tara:strand:+ start:996 stop:1520 length:525 start_codon:yes stop_codon:yes gene_type:complete
MFKHALQYGILAGLLNVISFFLSGSSMNEDGNMHISEMIGYTVMVLSFVIMGIGVWKYKTNFLGGQMSFMDGLKVSLLITGIISVVYTAGWMFYYYNFNPDFVDNYIAELLSRYQEQGLSEQELAVKEEELEQFAVQYKKPWVMIAMTFFEILPVGFLLSLATAFVLKSKRLQA